MISLRENITKRVCRTKRRPKETNIKENGLYWKYNRYKPFNSLLEIKINLFLFLFSRFFRFGVSHTPGIGRKRLLHLIATTLLIIYITIRRFRPQAPHGRSEFRQRRRKLSRPHNPLPLRRDKARGYSPDKAHHAKF